MQKENRIAVAIFIIAMLLRFVLCFYNREANDNHVDVVNWIVDKHQLPEKPDCWSCYQPKLYYVLSAGIVKLFHIEETGNRIEVMQLLNVVLSFFILLIFWKFIKKQLLNTKDKILVFAFFAVNPCLTGINIQSTNDTLVIFCGVLAVYYADSFFREPKWTVGAGLIIALIAAASAKASGIILAVVISIVFISKIFAERSKSKKHLLIKLFAILIISYGVIVPFTGGYVTNYFKYDNLTLSTWKKDTPPRFLQTTFVERPGVQSIFKGFFTFRYIDMIRQPYIANEWNSSYPLHRTSLWSQLYGRTVFMHFDQWPPTWQSDDPYIVNAGRILIAAGIVPLVIFLMGLFSCTFYFVKNFFHNGKSYLAVSNDYLHLGIACAFLLSSILYSYNYRDFSSMKSIYIFPGFLSYIKLFSDGFLSLKSKVIVKVVRIILIVMMIFSVYDILFLIHQLYGPLH